MDPVTQTTGTNKFKTGRGSPAGLKTTSVQKFGRSRRDTIKRVKHCVDEIFSAVHLDVGLFDTKRSVSKVVHITITLKRCHK